jgi:hypothetical protein
VEFYGGGGSPWPFFAGLVGYNAAGQIVNANGVVNPGSYGSSYYVCVAGESIAYNADMRWVQRTGWFKGKAATVPSNSPSGNPLVPRSVRNEIVEVAVILILNYTGPAGAKSQVDYVALEAYDADAAARLYTALDTSGNLQGHISGNTNVLGGSLYVPADQVVGVGSAGAPATITRTYRLPHSAFVPKNMDALTRTTRTNGQIGVTTAGGSANTQHYGWLLAAPGVTLTRITARLYRETTTLENAQVVLLRGTTTIATLTHTGTGWQEVQVVLAEPATATTVYELAVTLRTDVSTNSENRACLAWVELEYQRSSYADVAA